MEDLVSDECAAGHYVWQKIVGIEQLEPNGSQEGGDARTIKNGYKEENQAGAWDTEVGWPEDLYLGQGGKKN